MDRLVDLHLPSIFRFLRHLTRHEQDAEDLAQQTLLRAIANAARFDGRRGLRTWLFAIAFHEFTRWRGRKLWLPLTGDRPSPRNDHDRVIEAEALLDALSRLPDHTKAAFLMHYVEGMSVLEVAGGLGIPEGTAKSRLHSARAQLSQLLDKEVSYVTNPCQS